MYVCTYIHTCMHAFVHIDMDVPGKVEVAEGKIEEHGGKIAAAAAAEEERVKAEGEGGGLGALQAKVAEMEGE